MITNTAKLVFSAMLFSYITASQAIAFEQGTVGPYVDSITKWGAWELDIEPAAGGLKQPVTRALYTRDSKLTVRTNSFAALAPPRQNSVQITPPPAPPTRPPFGGPSDGFF